jgi:EmrB/QacA subfamily drug resistance transporter
MTDASSPPDSSPGWAPLVAVCLGTFMLLVDVTIVNVALPDMALDLHASFAGLQWVVDAYALALAALLLIVGSISDAVGRRRTYVAGLGVFVLASLACGLAPSEGVLVTARALQGIGGAAMFATTIALISSAYTGRARGVAFGIWGATNGAAAAAGPIAGGLLTQTLSWRWVFFVNIPIGLVTMILARRALAETRPADRPTVDWAGGAAFTVASAAATFALIRANEQGWTSAATLGLLAVAAAALAVFVAIERHARAPMFDLALLREGPLAGILVAGVVLSAAAFSALVYASIWLQTVLGLGPISAGLVTLPLSALAFVVAAGTGRILHGASPRLVLAGGLALVAVGNLLQVGLGGDSNWPRLLAGLAVVGVGVGAMSPLLASAAMAAVPQERSGMAAGAVNTARQLGLAIGIAILGAVFSSRISDHLADQPRGGGIADAAASGGARGVLAHAPAGARAHIDAAIHDAVGSALGTTFLVAGLAGLAGTALVLILMRERGARVTAGSPAAVPSPTPEAARTAAQ